MSEHPSGNGILLYGSNDPEVLVEKCVENLGACSIDPFQHEEFLVQSRGMSTWLKLNLAQKAGIFGQSKFRFPEETIWMILRGFTGNGPSRNPFTKEGMAWRIFEILPALTKENPGVFSPVVSYLAHDSGNLERCFRLCRQISTLFDTYQTYRPEMILAWSEGRQSEGDHPWQSIIWRELHASIGQKCLPELVLEIQKMEVPKDPHFLPLRLSVFGISTLPPIFLDVLHAYSRIGLLQVYSLQPAPVMGGDVQSEKSKQRAINRLNKDTERVWQEEDLNIESGNPLIGSLGRTGREFFNLLIDRNANDIPLHFRQPGGGSLLSSLQHWIFEVFTDLPEDRPSYDPHDSSIRVMSCHSPMREAEVLRDYLLGLFADDSTLKPGDVLVMMPNPEAYAPYLRAAFGDAENEQQNFFPYSIIDREPRQQSQLVNFFFNLLEFFEGRASNREVLDLLDSLPMRARFELSDEDIDLYRQWVAQCHLHWGMDGGHRASLGSTATDEHTWKHALDRMALGYCMRSNDTRTWEGIMPYGELEGENTLRFSKLFQVVDGLRTFEQLSRMNKTLSDWKKFLDSLTSFFFPQNNETLLDRQRIIQAVDDLDIVYGNLAPNSSVTLRVIRYHLSNVVESGATQGQFLSQGVTFCGLRPMRSVNARVICMIGMNDGAFPRQSQSLSFDLSGNRQPGDRSAREDDRYLFLESLWCARDHLYLSYVGQSIRRKEKIPPSVVVNELLDALDKVCDFGNSEKVKLFARDALVEHQSLHPFGPENFTGKKNIRSFSSEQCLAARALMTPQKRVQPFVSSPVSKLPELINEVSIRDFVRFFESPAKYFLVNRLGISLWQEDAPPSEHEPMSLDNLQKYGIKRSLLSTRLNEGQDINLYALEKAKGSLPPGSLGKVWFNDTAQEVDQFMGKWGDALRGTYDRPLHFEAIFSGTRLVGEIDSILDGCQVLYRCGVTRPKDRLTTWIRHLIACTHESGPFRSQFFGMDKSNKFLSFRPVEPSIAEQILSDLMEIFQAGTTRPIPFFPASSYAYHKERMKSADPKDEQSHASALALARKEWESTDQSRGGPKEGESIENITCFREDPIAQNEFPELARKIFDPLILAQLEEKEL